MSLEELSEQLSLVDKTTAAAVALVGLVTYKIYDHYSSVVCATKTHVAPDENFCSQKYLHRSKSTQLECRPDFSGLGRLLSSSPQMLICLSEKDMKKLAGTQGIPSKSFPNYGS